jgi:hypothetical protein
MSRNSEMILERRRGDSGADVYSIGPLGRGWAAGWTQTGNPFPVTPLPPLAASPPLARINPTPGPHFPTPDPSPSQWGGEKGGAFTNAPYNPWPGLPHL